MIYIYISIHVARRPITDTYDIYVMHIILGDQLIYIYIWIYIKHQLVRPTYIHVIYIYANIN